MFPIKRFHFSLLFLSLCLLAVGQSPAGVGVQLAPPPLDPTGRWHWEWSSGGEGKDLETILETWHFQRSGAALNGWYERIEHNTAAGQTYICSGQAELTRDYIKYFEGTISGRRIELHETRVEVRAPGPCDSGKYDLYSYTGELSAAGGLVVKSGEFAQTLILEAADYYDPPHRDPDPPRNLTGLWDWENFITKEEEGNKIEEHEQWELTQLGETVFGTYRRTAAYDSTDGRTFNCNQELSYKLETQYWLLGTLTDNRLVLEEKSSEVAGDLACWSGKTTLFKYRATWDGSEKLGLYYGDDNTLQILKLKQAATAPRPGRRDYSRSLTGEWRWSGGNWLESGVRYRLEEEYSLAQEGIWISGVLKRKQRYLAKKGATYPCNGGREVILETEFDLRGRIESGVFVIVEAGFRIPDPSPCDDGKRVRRYYRGSYSGGAELRLEYHDKEQTLRRTE